MTTENAIKTEDKQLRDYELVIIFSPEVVDDNFTVVMDKINRFITENGGIISEVEKWGKRKLAYPIRHFLEGNYVLSRFKLKPAASKSLEANLRILEEVLRYLLIKLSK